MCTPNHKIVVAFLAPLHHGASSLGSPCWMVLVLLAARANVLRAPSTRSRLISGRRRQRARLSAASLEFVAARLQELHLDEVADRDGGTRRQKQIPYLNSFSRSLRIASKDAPNFAASQWCRFGPMTTPTIHPAPPSPRPPTKKVLFFGMTRP